MKNNKKGGRPHYQRSDIPYADRLLIERCNSVAKHRNDAAATALKLACVALNDSEGLGFQRLTRFARTLRGLIDEYYSDIEMGEAHLNERLQQMGFVVLNGRMMVPVAQKDADDPVEGMLPEEFPEGGGEMR